MLLRFPVRRGALLTLVSRPQKTIGCRLPSTASPPSSWRGHTGSAAPTKDSSASASASVDKTYSDTLNLPSTRFALYTTDKAQLEMEATLLSQTTNDVYAWQLVRCLPTPLSTSPSNALFSKTQEARRGKTFVLHDGPPYANGQLHMGSTTPSPVGWQLRWE